MENPGVITANKADKRQQMSHHDLERVQQIWDLLNFRRDDFGGLVAVAGLPEPDQPDQYCAANVHRWPDRAGGDRDYRQCRHRSFVWLRGWFDGRRGGQPGSVA